jgi:hypothetical protein
MFLLLFLQSMPSVFDEILKQSVPHHRFEQCIADRDDINCVFRGIAAITSRLSGFRAFTARCLVITKVNWRSTAT